MMKSRSSWMVKILAVVIAILLRSYVVEQKNPEKTSEIRNVPVAIMNMEDLTNRGLTVMSPESVTVNVSVTGRLSDMKKFNEKKIEAQLNLKDYHEGESRIPISVKLLETGGVRIKDYEPREVLFDIEQVVTRSKPVEVMPLGNPEKNHLLGVATSEVKMVAVKGPRSLVDQVAKVVAEVDVEKWAESNIMHSDLKPVNENNQEVAGVSLEIEQITVAIPIYNTKEVAIEPVLQGELSSNLALEKLTYTPEKITVQSEEDLENVTSIKTEALDLSNITLSGERQLALDMPENVKIVEGQEPYINLQLDIVKEIVKSYIYPISSLQVENSDDMYEANLEDSVEEIKLTVRGREQDMEQLDIETVSLEVKLIPEKGEQKVSVEVVGLPERFTFSVVPESLTFSLSELSETSQE